MSKIVPIGEWDARAALSAAIEGIDESDGVVILVNKKGSSEYISYTANLTCAETVYIMECKKLEVIEFDAYGE